MPRKKTGNWGNIYMQDDCKGLVIRWVDSKGKRRGRVLRGATLKEARAALAAEIAKVEKENIYGAPPPSEDSFAAYADEFLKMQERRITPHVIRGRISRGEYDRQRGIVEGHLKPFFGTMKLGAIRRADIVKYIHSREGEVAAGTIIKEVNVLKRMLTIAVDLDKLAANPAQRVPMPKAPEGRTRFLSPDEWNALFEACFLPWESRQWLQQGVALCVSLGLRRGELLNIAPADVNLSTRHVKLHFTKSGKPRTVFINDLAMQVFEAMGIGERQQKKDKHALFHGITAHRISERFRAAVKAAGIENFTLHDLRHTYASHLRMAGADTHDLMMLLGHADMRMTARYMHLTAEHLQKAASKLDGVLTLPAPKPS